jgi:hypothetical protein
MQWLAYNKRPMQWLAMEEEMKYKIYQPDCLCECGTTYEHHWADKYGLVWCPVGREQSFSPALLFREEPESDLVVDLTDQRSDFETIQDLDETPDEMV